MQHQDAGHPEKDTNVCFRRVPALGVGRGEKLDNAFLNTVGIGGVAGVNLMTVSEELSDNIGASELGFKADDKAFENQEELGK